KKYFMNVLKVKSERMRIAIFFMIAVLAACESGSKLPIAIEGSQIPAGAILQAYESIPGLQKAVMKQGEVVIGEGDFLNGKYHGTWTIYDAQGKVQQITTYLNGLKQGTELVFDNQGYVKTKSYYHNGELQGEYLGYKRRSIIERKNYSGGILDGLQQKYYIDGKVMEESTYASGQIDGVARWYDQEGNMTIEYTYKDGQLVKEGE
ncbi:MAG: hypothetical protein AAGA66_19130, partial [Bacteroidota bacterium]